MSEIKPHKLRVYLRYAFIYSVIKMYFVYVYVFHVQRTRYSVTIDCHFIILSSIILFIDNF